MAIGVLVTKTWRDFGARRLRSALLLLGIVIGVSGVVAIAYTARNLARAQSLAYVSANQADAFISVRQFPPQLTNVLEGTENVAAVESRVADYLQWSNGGPYRDILIYGVHDFENITINRPVLVEGRWPGAGEATLDISARQLQPVQLGDTIALRESVAHDPVYARISGFTRTPGEVDASILDRATGYAPAADVQRWQGEPGDNQLLLRLVEFRRGSETLRAINRVLDKRGIPHTAGTLRDPQNATGTKELAALLLLMGVFSAIGVVLSGFLVWNTMSAVMAEEVRQIGILRALGAAWWQVLYTYLLPACIVGIVGSVVGFGFGVLGGGALARYLGGLIGLALPPFTLEAREVLLGLAVGMGVSIGAALVPTIGATRVRVLDLVRETGVRNDYRRNLVQRLIARLRGRSAVTAMGVRNIWRRRGRSAITVLVVATGVAAFVGTQALNSSVRGTVDTLYGTYAADAWLSFNRRLSVDFTQTLRRDANIAAVEGWERDDAYVQQVRTDLWGIPADTQLYRYVIVAGRWVTPDEPYEAVITTSLAQRLGIHTGDKMDVMVGKRQGAYAVVGIVDDDSTYLGSHSTGKIFMDTATANLLAGRGPVADFFAVRFRDSSHAGVDAGVKEVQERFRSLEPSALTAYEDRQSTLATVQILTVLLLAMVVVIAVIGAIGLVNTLVLNVTERRREIGILRAIGAGTGALVRLLLAEGVTLGLLGYVLGLAGGYVLALRLVAIAGEELFHLRFTLAPGMLVVTGLLTLLLAAGASVAPGLIAARVRPIEAVRYE